MDGEDKVQKKQKNDNKMNRGGFQEIGQLGSPRCSVQVLWGTGIEEIQVPSLPSVPAFYEILHREFKGFYGK